MRSTIALLALATGLTAACDIPGVPKRTETPPAEQGLGAGAAPATPAPMSPVDTTATAMVPNTPAPAPTTPAPATKPTRVTDQTQSGVTDASGSSTLGSKVKKTRPDADQPVTAKGDVLIMRVDSATGAIITRRPGDSTPAATTPVAPATTPVAPAAVPMDSLRVTGNDTMPTPAPIPPR